MARSVKATPNVLATVVLPKGTRRKMTLDGRTEFAKKFERTRNQRAIRAWLKTLKSSQD